MKAGACYIEEQNTDHMFWNIYLQKEVLVEVLVLGYALGLMSYRMQSLVLFANQCCVQRIIQSLVFLHSIVCSLLGGHQNLSIPCEFFFLEYYSFFQQEEPPLVFRVYTGLFWLTLYPGVQTKLLSLP